MPTADPVPGMRAAAEAEAKAAEDRAHAHVLFRDDLLGHETLFQAPRDIIRADMPDEVAGAFARMDRARGAGRWCAGYVSYEAGYALDPALHDAMPDRRGLPLVHMGVFDAPRRRVPAPREAGTSARLSRLRPAWSFDAYAERFARLHRHIRQGDCYQANLTFPITARWEGAPRALFDAMTELQPVRYGALVDLGGPAVLSRSPELFFEVDRDGWIETHPMKGTIRRGTTPEEDADLAAFLQADAKSRAENVMIVDLLRNDISRVSEVGTLQVPDLFSIESYPTLHQMVSRVRARLVRDATISDIFGALFPCGSITGAPKIRAMQILRDLEAAPRDIYCGAIGYAAPDGRMRFNVAIRTAVLHEGGAATLNVGSGVVFASDARAEYDECLLKARFATGRPPEPPA